MFFKILLYGMISYLFRNIVHRLLSSSPRNPACRISRGLFWSYRLLFLSALLLLWRYGSSGRRRRKRISQNQTGCSYTPDPSPGVIDPQYGKSRPDSQPSFSVSGHSHDPDSLFCGQAPGLSRCGAGDHPRDAAIQRLCCFLLYHRTAQSICFLS